MIALAASLALSATLAAPTLRGAHVGALVVDAQTGSVVFAQHADDAFQPASTLKLIVGSAALSILGEDATLETDALTDGTISNRTLHGNLYLRGGGDPGLDDAALSAAVRELQAQSIAAIDGTIVADGSAFSAPWYPDGWTIDDLPNDYAAPITALAFNENTVALSLRPGATAGAAALIDVSPPNGVVSIENETRTGARGSQDSTHLLWPPNDPATIRIEGSVPLGEADPGELDAAVRDPLLFAADAFKRHFTLGGIDAAGARISEGVTPSQARLLWSHRSTRMRELVARMWLPSDNFYAESLLEELGAGFSAGGDTRERGILRESQWLATIGVDPKTLTIADASGVSQYDRVAPTALVTLLRSEYAGRDRDAVLAALPVAGRTGTLQGLFAKTPLEGTVFAKTGTMQHTRNLAGFLMSQDGRMLVFALFINDWIDSSPNADAAVHAVQEQFLEAARATNPAAAPERSSHV